MTRAERIVKIQKKISTGVKVWDPDMQWLIGELERADAKLAQILERLKDEAPYTPARDLIDEVQALIEGNGNG